MKYKYNRVTKVSAVFLLIVLVVSALMAGCKNTDNSTDTKTIRVGTNPEFPPFEYLNNNGDVDGFDVAVMYAIGDVIGYNVEFVSMEFKSLTGSLKTGGIDAAIAGMTVTEDRKQSVDFSDSYYTAVQSMILPINSTVQTLADLNGKKIAVQEGTTGDVMATFDSENDVITDQSTVVKRFKKGVDAVIELKSGSVDCVLIDSSPARQFVALNSDTLKCVDVTSSAEEYAIAVGKGNTELLSEINRGLKLIKENGTFDRLVSEYIDGNETITVQKTGNIFERFASSLKRVFIDTNGYVLLMKGLGVTILISIFAVILGVALGFIIALMKLTETRKKKRTVCSVIANVYINVLRGTPVLVQLLIMYMVIFNNRYGLVAAILTFGVNSGAYVAENVRAGILAVDKGQMEGGRSLGFSYGETMRYIILPQAIKNILPAMGNEFITLIKETSVVGYVAIQDLTKAADFIISRTYETFLPLIAIAIIYYCLVSLLTYLLRKIERRLRQSDLH